MNFLFFLSFLFSFISFISSCFKLEITGSLSYSFQFHLLSSSLPSLNQRNIYKTENTKNKTYYLYFIILNEKEGIGRWIINDILGSTTQAIAYIDSWSILPYLINEEKNQSNWIVYNNGWKNEPNFKLICTSSLEDNLLPFYFDPLLIGWELSGYYLPINNTVYLHVKLHYQKQLYFYKYYDQWIIGENPNINVGLAYITDSLSRTPFEITKTNQWNILQDKVWITNVTANLIYTNTSLNENKHDTINKKLRRVRSLQLPTNKLQFTQQQLKHRIFRKLSNGLNIPLIGLGTGGIGVHKLPTTLQYSNSIGYQLYDLAREYRNEHIVGRLLTDSDVIPSLKGQRKNMFLISKVWPTHLGYQQTINQVIASLNELKTNYIDLYLLHWPQCYSHISWMHCETTVDVEGNWKQSYRALERLYEEGKILSIGVSNFDIKLLEQLRQFAKIMPHVVQNQADIMIHDIEVRKWCDKYKVVYIPYATGRNIKNLQPQIFEFVNGMSKKYNVSNNALISQYFLQTGAVIIPRTTIKKHLQENINLLSWKLDESDFIALTQAKDIKPPEESTEQCDA